MKTRTSSIPLWLIWALFAVFCWGIWAILSKLIGNALTAAQSQAISTAGTLPVMAFLARSKQRGQGLHDTRGNWAAFAAGLFTCLGNIPYYHAMKIGNASSVIPLTAMYPMVTIVGAMVFLRERSNPIQWIGLALSLTSIWLFNVPGVDGVLTGWLAYAMIPVVMWGVSGLFQKISTNHVSGEQSTLWFLAAFAPVALVLLAIEPLGAIPSFRTLSLSLLLGLSFALGNYAILVAFARGGKASVIAPLAAMYPLVSVPIAVTFLEERISSREGIAIAVALIAVVALAWETAGSGGSKTEDHPPGTESRDSAGIAGV